ncbi:MAG: hypothetical protein CSA65_02510 [Proteobacteria bacterium]|nr:MAG: hypothetical protein CSA65_02510 [Pseudomonadota bacterium]
MRGRWSTVCTLLAIALVWGGCRRPRRPSRPAASARPREGAHPRRPPPDLDYAQTRPVWARSFQLSERLAPQTPRSFARVGDAQRANLAKLQRRSTLAVKVYVEAQRTLIVLPSTHPLASARLLLGRDLDRLWVHSPDKWSYERPLAALPDTLDCARYPSERRRHDRLHLRPLGGDSPRQGAVEAHLEISMPYRYRKGALGAPRWNLQLQLRLELVGHIPVWLRPPDPRSWPLAPLALPLAAPDDETLADVLRSAPRGHGAVLGWLRVIDNHSLGSRPLRLHTTVEDRGWVRMPARHFSSNQPGYRRATWIHPLHRDGLQLVPESQLAGLRAASVAASEEVTLAIENQSDVATFIHLDGVRIGWVAPGKSYTFRGMPAGYYRISAHAPSGVRAWDPRDLYLPGKLALR